MNAIFDEAKGVYRVNNPDGTFSTYTPAQYRELSAVPTTGDADVVTTGDVDVVTTGDVDVVTTGDVDVVTTGDVDVVTTGDANVVLGLYKTLQPIPYTDEEGNVLGEAEVGSVQEVPVELGDSWVEQGLAEKFIEEDNTQA